MRFRIRSHVLGPRRYPVLGPPEFRTCVWATLENRIPLRGIKTDEQTAMSRRKSVTYVLTQKCYRCLDHATTPHAVNSESRIENWKWWNGGFAIVARWPSWGLEEVRLPQRPDSGGRRYRGHWSY